MKNSVITRITGTGSCLPEQIVTNEDLSKVVDTSDEWISSRTGIRERHLAKDETTASMAAEAGRRALQDAGIGAEEVDLLIVGTITGDYVTPSTSCEVQEILGAVNAVAFDINAACAGFMFALHTAHAYLQSGIYKTALVLGAETLSKIMDWKDRSTCVLFGDGAGAAVVRAFEKGKAEDKAAGGILAFEQGSDGRKGKVLSCLGRRNNNPLIENPFIPSYVSMNGQEVYKFAVRTVPKAILEAVNKAGLLIEDIDLFVLHQANMRIIESVSKRLKVPIEKFPVNLETCGNISAGSVPVLLDAVNQKGMLKKGDKIVLAGFGAGLSWGACVLVW